MSARPKLLFLAQRMPYPPTKGEKIRALQTLKYFRRTHDIYLGCCVDDAADLPYIAELRALCAELYVARLHPTWERLRCLRGLLTGAPLTVAYFQNRGLSRWLRDVLARVRPDILFAYSSNITPCMLDLPFAGRRIVDLVDADSEKFRAYAETARFPMRFIYAREAEKIAALEKRIAQDCDAAIFVSEPEAAVFRALVPDHPDTVRAIGNGVDHVYFNPAVPFDPPFATTRKNIVFTGTMDYKPNIDAAIWFATEILPLIRQRIPDAQFHIVGANPAAEVLRLARDPAVHVSGRVPDVRPYLAHADVAVAPMRIARGIQNKVLEAMAMARPMVVTAQALEGISAVPDRDIILAEGAENFAARCIQLATSAEAEKIGTAARLHVVTHCEWAARLAAYDTLLQPG